MYTIWGRNGTKLKELSNEIGFFKTILTIAKNDRGGLVFNVFDAIYPN